MEKQWPQLEKDLVNLLKIESLNHNLIFRNSNQAIIGAPSDGFRSDGMLIIKNTLLAIEVEAGQSHPDTNVGKYWFQWDKYKKFDHIILFHIFTPMYNSYNWRKELAGFYAEKMKVAISFEYNLLDLRKNADYDHVYKKSWGEIKKVIDSLLNQSNS